MSRYCSALLLLFSVALLSGCAAGRNSFNSAEKLEAEGKYDEAVLGYAEAVAANPEVSEYRLRYLSVAEKGAGVHLAKGQAHLEKNNLEDALREFQYAIALDPALERASQLSEETQHRLDAEMFRREGESFERENKLKEALRSYQRSASMDSGNTAAKDAVKRLLGARKSKLDGYELNLKSQQPITLKFRDAKLKEVFDIITKLSGINFIFDEGVKEQKVTINLEKATFNQAVEVVTGMYKLGRKVLNDSTIILYPKTPDKMKNYEELVVRTFYLNQMDAKKAVNLLRTMLQLKKIYVNEDTNALVVRDTPETIDVVERILDANDVPDAEVLLEVEIIELAKANQEKLGLALSSYAVSAKLARLTSTGDQLLSDSFSQVTTSSGSTTTEPTTITNLGRFALDSAHGYFTVPNATFNFGKTLSNGETLSNPKLRVKNREKAKFNVGTRVPITTISTTSTTSGYSVNVQYVDVGVKMNAEPTILLDNQISLKLSLEVSSIINKDEVGLDNATTVVTIGTRNLDTVLNLKDGETTIIGGLIQNITSKSKDKISILGDIPVIGPLLTNHSDSNDKTELILAITPRLIKGMTVPDSEVVSFWSGRDDEPSTASPYVSFSEEPEFAPPAKEKQGKAAPPAPAAKAAEAAAIAAPAAAPAAEAASASAPDVSAASVPAPVVAPAEILWNLPESVKSGDTFNLGVEVLNAVNLHSAPLVVSYDPALVEFVSAKAGPMFEKDGQPVTFLANADPATGTLTVTIGRSAGVPGVTGDGNICVLAFKALAAAGTTATFSFKSISLEDQGGNPLPVESGDVVVEMQ